jgi:hypothetical protein
VGAHVEGQEGSTYLLRTAWHGTLCTCITLESC